MEIVIEWLDAHGLTRKWLAQQMRVSLSTVSQYAAHCKAKPVRPEHREAMQKVMKEYEPEKKSIRRQIVTMTWVASRQKYHTVASLSGGCHAYGNTRMAALRALERVINEKYPGGEIQ